MVKKTNSIDYKSIIFSFITALLISVITWMVSFIWESDNKIQMLIDNQSKLIDKNGRIKPSLEVEILKVKFENFEKKINCECE